MIQSTKGFCTVVCVSVTRSVYDYVISLEQREERERGEKTFALQSQINSRARFKNIYRRCINRKYKNKAFTDYPVLAVTEERGGNCHSDRIDCV